MKKELTTLMGLAAMSAMFEQPMGLSIPPANLPGEMTPSRKPNAKRVKPKTFKKPKRTKNKTAYAQQQRINKQRKRR